MYKKYRLNVYKPPMHLDQSNNPTVVSKQERKKDKYYGWYNPNGTNILDKKVDRA